MPPRPSSLLVNYWYAHQVGHALEGLRYALGYFAANPEQRVSLLLNGATAIELAHGSPFLDRVYSVPFRSFMGVEGNPAASLAGVPQTWDYVVENRRARERPHQAFAGFKAFYDALHAHFQPRHPTGLAGSAPPGYLPHQHLRLEPPAQARLDAREAIGEGRPAISILLAGSSDRCQYPSIASWQLILTALSESYPSSVICLIGKLRDDGRTSSRISRDEVDLLLRVVPRAIDCFDRPLWEQVALIEASDLLVSPHTGFSFAASAVGTPWLVISGGNWHEYFFNGVPVYSVLPDTERYPCFSWGALGPGPLPVIDADDDGEGPRTPSMSAARIRDDLPKLMKAAALLIQNRLPYEEALAEYFPRLLAAYGGNHSKIFSFDNIHEQFLS